jgi:hypothetical protein
MQFVCFDAISWFSSKDARLWTPPILFFARFYYRNSNLLTTELSSIQNVASKGFYSSPLKYAACLHCQNKSLLQTESSFPSWSRSAEKLPSGGAFTGKITDEMHKSNFRRGPTNDRTKPGAELTVPWKNLR